MKLSNCFYLWLMALREIIVILSGSNLTLVIGFATDDVLFQDWISGILNFSCFLEFPFFLQVNSDFISFKVKIFWECWCNYFMRLSQFWSYRVILSIIIIIAVIILLGHIFFRSPEVINDQSCDVSKVYVVVYNLQTSHMKHQWHGKDSDLSKV